ncbi:Polysaccharide export protein [Granulibacter bethesdensis]|nr:Polysaccharide export protein [Granulibacter bethesdensis]
MDSDCARNDTHSSYSSGISSRYQIVMQFDRSLLPMFLSPMFLTSNFRRSEFRPVGLIFVLVVYSILGACALPNAGPLANDVEQTKDVQIIQVTPDIAAQMVEQQKARQRTKISTALARLSNPVRHHDAILHPGDTVQVTLWSFPDALTANQVTASSGPQQTKLGEFQIDTTGAITLPYVGKVVVGWKTEGNARKLIKQQFVTLGIVHDPDVTITHSNSHDAILVTGSTGEPKILTWNPGGVSLSHAITLALGNGTSTLSENSALSSSTNAISATVIRQGEETDIPIPVALSSDIALQPADKVVIRREPAVHVTVGGGGVMNNGLYGFSKEPSLASALAEAHGLNPNAADSTRIFVFRQKTDIVPTLYVLSWKSGSGLMAAQLFPVEDGDIVYVAESPMVPVSRVINIIFQMALPAAMLH